MDSNRTRDKKRVTLGKGALSDFCIGFLGFVCLLGLLGLLGGPSTKVAPAKGHYSLALNNNQNGFVALALLLTGNRRLIGCCLEKSTGHQKLEGQQER